MKITQVNAVLLSGPSSIGDTFTLSFRKLRSAAFIEIVTDTELTGVGETCVGYHLPEVVPSVVDFFAPILIGLKDHQINPRVIWDRMYKAGTFWSRNGIGMSVMAGIEGALWDLRGKMDKMPVHHLLGGCVQERLLAYATGSHTPYPWDDLKRKLDIYRGAGFRAAKLGAGWYNHTTAESFASTNVSAWVDMESEKVRVWREHVGPEFKICLDGHMGNVDADKRAWDVATARSVLKAIEPYDVFFFEEPLDYRDREGYAELTRATAVPVAGGEVLTSREEFQTWADDRALDIAQPDAAVVGISAFVDIARMFAARGKRIAPHCWESGPAVMQNIHAAFACANVCIVEVPPVPGGLLTDVYADGYRFHDGYLLPPEAPGLGVRLNETIKHKYRFVPGSGEWSMVPGMPKYL